MRLYYFTFLLSLTACGNNETTHESTSIIKYTKYFDSDTAKVEEVSYYDSITKKGHSVFYNYFGDTNKIEFTTLAKLDSVQHYTYFCTHYPDTIINVTEIGNVEHNTKHKQSLTFTEVFIPAKNKIVYDSINFIMDSLFMTKKENYKGVIY